MVLVVVPSSENTKIHLVVHFKMWVLLCIMYISIKKKKDPGVRYCFPIPQSTHLGMDQWGLSKRQFKANANLIKNPYANAGNTGNASSVPGSGKSPGKGHGNPLQYSCLENPMARAARWVTVHGVTKVRHYWAHIHNSRSWPVPNLKIRMRERERDRERETQTWSTFFQLFKRVFINFNNISQFCRQKSLWYCDFNHKLYFHE